MIGRRDLLVGGGALAASAAAAALTPRTRLVLAKGGSLEKAVPHDLPGWKGVQTDGLVLPRGEDDLATKLYSEIVQRVYQRADGAFVMLLIAYGDTQSDLLQLHRPEICYAAFGFTISDSHPRALALAPNVVVPSRQLVATAPNRVEHILYWTRIGEYLPVDGHEQRMMKLRTQFAGIIPDGALIRISTSSPDAATSYAINASFAVELLDAVPAAMRPALIGSDRAARFDRAVARG